MNMQVKVEYFKNPKNRELTEIELSELARELDAIKQEVLDDLGEKDAQYIRRIYSTIRYSSIAGRALLFAGWFPPAWLLGTGLLGFSKILENMELGHNVMHGQYDWMNDPLFNGTTYEWDIVGTAEDWRQTHNYKHHTYTNIKGMDDDIGYGIIRLFPEQRWKKGYLLQPLYSIPFCLLFQWGVAIQNLEIGKYIKGRMSKDEFKTRFKPMQKKMSKQLFKDYIFFPLLAGPAALPVLAGNCVANGIRNIWTFSIIFCGHFTKDVEVFPKTVLENESRGHWYMRQIRGSSNLTGSEAFHILTGHLSHQIEHHLYPDVPARRYRKMAPKVEAVCKKYGINYNNANLFKQYGSVIKRIAKYAFPFKK
ncbi:MULTISPECIES: acyl-CoA desaturase [unclassified Acinetobacter]|uniref:fatty acid desaturase family protein n=1 Tax=unclassified Acinetobacter TaxID=196816 RepID=UPI002934D211|nr:MULTISPECIES: acyl-CoA desaturase [unclassified Acinetobacter]WOE32019.1 acyl-CoA desaturase [Acinetobacter sp. SAAs470]WOE37487.1 acyl-CoA desaturase [Acinetobacter sp. SAAs474]